VYSLVSSLSGRFNLGTLGLSPFVMEEALRFRTPVGLNAAEFVLLGVSPLLVVFGVDSFLLRPLLVRRAEARSREEFEMAGDCGSWGEV